MASLFHTEHDNLVDAEISRSKSSGNEGAILLSKGDAFTICLFGYRILLVLASLRRSLHEVPKNSTLIFASGWDGNGGTCYSRQFLTSMKHR